MKLKEVLEGHEGHTIHYENGKLFCATCKGSVLGFAVNTYDFLHATSLNIGGNEFQLAKLVSLTGLGTKTLSERMAICHQVAQEIHVEIDIYFNGLLITIKPIQ
jgi:hypothetical protein